MKLKMSPGCDCRCSSGCDVTFGVRGCNSILMAGASVSVWADSSKAVLYGSGVTDGSGHATINVPPGGYYYEATHPRFTDTGSGTGTCSGAAGSVNVPLSSAASGYVCTLFCGLPLPSTLHYSDTFNGSITLTWTGSVWRGSTTTTFPGGTDSGGNTCVGVTQTVTISIAPTGGTTVGYKRVSPACTRCAGGTTNTNCSGGNAQGDCSSGAFVATVEWLSGLINPVDLHPILGTFTE